MVNYNLLIFRRFGFFCGAAQRPCCGAPKSAWLASPPPLQFVCAVQQSSAANGSSGRSGARAPDRGFAL